MGTCLVLAVVDGRSDTGASRLCRLVEAFDAWGHVQREAWQLEDQRGWNRRGADAAEQPPGRRALVGLP